MISHRLTTHLGKARPAYRCYRNTPNKDSPQSSSDKASTHTLLGDEEHKQPFTLLKLIALFSITERCVSKPSKGLRNCFKTKRKRGEIEETGTQ